MGRSRRRPAGGIPPVGLFALWLPATLSRFDAAVSMFFFGPTGLAVGRQAPIETEKKKLKKWKTGLVGGEVASVAPLGRFANIDQ